MTIISLITWLLFQLTIWVVLLIFLLPLSVVLWVIFKSLFTNENGRWEVNIRTLQKPFEEAMKGKVKAELKAKTKENDDALTEKKTDKISIIKDSGFEINENTTKVLGGIPNDIDNQNLVTPLTEELSQEAEEKVEKTKETNRQAEVSKNEGIVYLDKPTSFPSDYISDDTEAQIKEKVE